MTDRAANHNIKSVHDLLARARTLKQLTLESRQLEQLNQRFLSRLPSMLAQYCRLISYRNGRVQLRAQSATVATHLRFTAPQLIEQLRKTAEFSALQSLDIQVGKPEPVNNRPVRKPVRRTPVSPAVTAMLKDTADNMDSDDLAQSLRKLARTLEQLSR